MHLFFSFLLSYNFSISVCACVCAHVYVEVRGQHLGLSTLFLKQGFSLHMEFSDLDLARLAASQPRDPQP